MDIIKEHVKNENGARCIIRTNTYAKSFGHFCMLVNEARKDFDVADEEVDVVHYGGQSYARTFGIEFNTTQQIPEAYRQVSHVEFSL